MMASNVAAVCGIHIYLFYLFPDSKMNRKPLTVGEALVELLAEYGVDLVFGIPGTHSIELYRGLSRVAETGEIRHISPRHEQGGGFMADGYARISGKPGVCFVITGPGVTNISTPLGEACMDAVPMLVISPVNEPDADNYNRGRLHEITNQSAVTAPLTAFSVTVGEADEIPQLLARAFALFASEKPQPVHISIPLSILPMPVRGKWSAVAPPSPPLASNEQIAQAIRMIENAARPVVIAGGGTSRCAVEVVALGEAIPCPLLTTVAGRGVAPASHPLSVGAQVRAPRVQALLEDADLAIFLGTEFAQADLWNDDLKIPTRQIWVNLSRGALQREGEVLAIHAEAGDTARRITEKLPPAKKTQCERVHGRCAALRESHAGGFTSKEKIHWAVLAELMKHLPKETLIVSDMTQLAYTAIDYLPLERPNSWFHPTGYGTLGYALPAAIGALLAGSAHLPRQALVLVGDAGLQYTFQEMTLAAELELNLVVLLWNNDELQQIHDDMKDAGIPPLGIRQQNPDFIALAHACNWRARIVKSLRTLGVEIEQAFNETGPVLLRLDQDSIPPP